MIAVQFADVMARFKGATLERLPSGAALIAVPNFVLPPGWSSAESTIRFLAPVNYPYANPDCFWADGDLRLANGGEPRNSALNSIPETSLANLRWFSWHVHNNWNPSRDTLMSWMASIAARFWSAT
ncbi:E2/UBC family protein [uncultured Rhodoblastus sp.]|uniref:E2/UBC family protein n=1 Tax=uncultured Rhodoblastus sp. TaxID=543037 RepID=UPI0025D5000C|nr:E2/UBC family protein [uncultured Rhodoblastus sp.]